MAKKKTGNTFLSTQTVESYSSEAKKKADEIKKSASSNATKSANTSTYKGTASKAQDSGYQKRTTERRNQEYLTSKKDTKTPSKSTQASVQKNLQSKYGDNKVNSTDTIKNLTEGTLKQIAGGHLKSIGTTTNEVDFERDKLKSAYTRGKIDKDTYKQNLEALNKSGKAKMYDTNKQKAANKEGLSGKLMNKTESFYDYLAKKGNELNEAGDKQVEKANKNLNTFEKIASGAYTSGIGMATDMLAGPMWGASMMSRTFGNELGSAKKQGADTVQDVQNAGLQAAKEWGSELIFGGIAAPMKIAGKGMGYTEKLLDKAVSKITNQTAKNAVYSIGKRLASSLEEGAEEVIAGLVEPIIQNKTYADELGIHQDIKASDIVEAVASAGLMTAVMGAGSAAMVRVNKEYTKASVDFLGGEKELAKIASNVDDPTMASRAEANYQRLEGGNALADEQVSEMLSAVVEQADITRKELVASRQAVYNKVTKEDGNFVLPLNAVERYNLDGSPVLREGPTAEAHDEYMAEAMDKIASLTSDEAQAVATSISNIRTGIATVSDVQSFSVTEPESRAAFEEATGLKLPVIYNKNSTVNSSMTNYATRQFLIKQSMESARTMAERETANFVDTQRGAVNSDVMQGLGKSGASVFHNYMDGQSSLDSKQYYIQALAFRDAYNAARTGAMSLDQLLKINNPFRQGLDELIKSAYESGEADRNAFNDVIIKGGKKIADTKGLEKTDAGIDMSNVKEENYSMLKESDREVFEDIARMFNLKIVFFDDAPGKNGFYDNGVVCLNINNEQRDRDIDMVFRHEFTHHIRTYAPAQYKELEDLVRQRWYKGDSDAYAKAIQGRIDLYAKHEDSNGNTIELTEEGAVEELIADISGELDMSLEDIRDLAATKPSLFQAILDALRNIITKIRLMLGRSNGYAYKYNRKILERLDIYNEYERLFTIAAREAYANRAKVGLIRSGWKGSLAYHAGDLGKSTVDDYWNQGYGRDTGHFGFGTYFVGDESQINDYGYGKRSHYAVDFDKYNLYRPGDFQQALDLHDGLRILDGYAEDYSKLKDVDIDAKVNFRDEIENAITEYEWNAPQDLADISEGQLWMFESDADEYERSKSYLLNLLDKMDSYTKDQILFAADRRYNELHMTEDEAAAMFVEDENRWRSRIKADDADVTFQESIEEAVENKLQRWNSDKKSNEMFDREDFVVKEIIGRSKDYISRQESDWERVDRAENLLVRGLGYRFTAEEIDNAIRKTEQIVSEYEDYERGNDSAATVFMKQLGFDGVDVRHIPEMDNVGFGSVIYELKGEDLAKKQEIGTAKYSISESQDKAYMDAVNRGDMGTAQRMVDEAAKRAGYNLVAYHGTTRGGFTVFNTENGLNNNMGSHFGSKEVAEGFASGEFGSNSKGNSQVYKVYLKSQNPYETFDWFGQDDYYPAAVAKELADEIGTPEAYAILEQIKGISPNIERIVNNPDEVEEGYIRNDVDREFPDISGTEARRITDERQTILYGGIRNLLELGGYDSIQYENGLEIVGDIDTIIQRPEQIKSADPITYDENDQVIPLSQRFDITNNDLRYSVTETEYNQFRQERANTYNDILKGIENGMYNPNEFDMWYSFYSKWQIGECNKDNFFYNTMCDFKSVSRRPNRKPNFVSYSKDGNVSSEYWYTDKGVVRGSKHWGKDIASCDWAIDGKHKESLTTNMSKTYGYADWSDFVFKTFEKEIDGKYYLVNFDNTIGKGGAATDTDIRYSVVDDAETIDFLENQNHVTVYRAMVLIDGQLYPPMSSQTKSNGLRPPEQIGQWIQSEIDTNPKNFEKDRRYILKKDNGKTVPARYNPYIHSSPTMLNDQFATAYKRHNLVVVEGVIPESELTSGYRAEHLLDDGTPIKAKDTTGKIEWKAGSVQAKLSGKRTVYLSRWFKPTRIVPDAEVADSIAEMLDGENVKIPENVVTPSLLSELEKRNIPIDYTISKESMQGISDNGAAITDGGSVVKYSLASWNETDIEALTDALKEAGFEDEEIGAWIENVNSVASVISDDMSRLNYAADAYQKALKDNDEYYFTLDLSTLCQKRRLYQGTYNAIMKRIVNKGLHPEDTIHLRYLMDDLGYETPCGICYEESRKKNEGKFAEVWLNGISDRDWNAKLKAYDKSLKKYEENLKEYEAGNKKRKPKVPKKPERWLGYANMEHNDKYIPTIDDVTTTDGRDMLRENHPEALENYLEWQKGRGSANPKVSFTHTDYRGDILKLTKAQIESLKHIGGLRIQSFSDFETVHVIDMMQAVLDMAAMKLTSQAYTKVPAFADIFGGTGIKINLSLIGQVKDGKLVFDAKEGIDPDEAFRIREKYSDNVGTILVGANTESILAAWADDRIDMVIPFHRSGWGKREFKKLGLGGYEDFQTYQTEKYLDGEHKDGVKLSEVKMEAIYSADYWDYTKTGKENAEAYLKLCAEKHYRPVFYNFLHDNGDGTWSLQEDGSTEGYWKSLVDYKMYNNEGKAAPQQEVKPIFDMEVAQATMDAYEGNADTLPVAEDVVDKFVDWFNNKGKKYSVVSVEEDVAYMSAIKDNDMDAVQRMVDEVAKRAGYDTDVYHGSTALDINVFDPSNRYIDTKTDGWNWFAASEDYAKVYKGYNGKIYKGFLNTDNLLDVGSIEDDAIVIGDDNSINYTDHFVNVADMLGVSTEELYDRVNKDYGGSDTFNALEDFMYPPYDYEEDGEDKTLPMYMFTRSGEFRRLVESLGYNGIATKEGDDNDVAYGVSSSNQFKSAEPITYDENDNIIPLSQRFNSGNEDIRYSVADAISKYPDDPKMENWHQETRNATSIKAMLRNADIKFSIPQMNVLVACEESQAVCKELRKLGHNAYSCDIQAQSGGHPEWHIKGDVSALLNGNCDYTLEDGTIGRQEGKWDMIIAFPPCTHLATSGAKHFEQKRADGRQREAIEFFCSFFDADCDKLVIENPVNIIGGEYMKKWYPDIYERYNKDNQLQLGQSVQPWMFGDNVNKRTCLWLRGVPELVPAVTQEPQEVRDNKDANGFSNWYNANRGKGRSKTFPGVANAMANTFAGDARFSVVDKDFMEDFINERADSIDGVEGDETELNELRQNRSDFLTELYAAADAIVKKQTQLTNGTILDEKKVKADVQKLLEYAMQNSEYTGKYKNSLKKEIVEALKVMHKAIVDKDAKKAGDIAYQMSAHIVDSIELTDDYKYNASRDLREYLRNMPIAVSEEDKADIDWPYFKKHNFGRMRLTQDGHGIDTLWNEILPMLREIANTKEYDIEDMNSTADMLNCLSDALDRSLPAAVVRSASETTQLMSDIANDLYDIAYDAESWKSFADRKKIQYDEKTKRLKERQKEAIRELRNNINERVKKRTTTEVKRRLRSYKRRELERKERREYFREKARRYKSISKNYDRLVKMLLEPDTKSLKLIPEQFRTCVAGILIRLDLQTERSKKLEAKYNRVSQKQQKARKIKDLIRDIVEDGEEGDVFSDNEYNEYISELAEKVERFLDGTDENVVDKYDLGALNSLNDLLATLVHSFNNYNKTFASEKQQEIGDIATKIVNEADEQQKLMGSRKEYNGGILGFGDKFLNESMTTPIDLFENMGSGWLETYMGIRRGLNKHTLNMDYLRKAFAQMFAQYANDKKPGSDIESWRDEYNEYTLQDGSKITLTAAQIMSLYCHSKRVQSMGHIDVGGVTVSQIESSSTSKVKDKVIGARMITQSQATKISRADIDTLVKSLSKEQIAIADALQKMLNTTIADWGNETSMAMYGIKLFREQNYFPITVSRMEIDSKVDDAVPEPAEKIRNFGFTKPLKPNASQALVLDDIFRVVCDHCNKMSLYNAYAMPIADFQRVFNYREKNDIGEIILNVKGKTNAVYGNQTISYIMKMMADINGSTATYTSGIESIMDKSLALYKKAAIGANLRVFVQQPTAIVRAFNVIDTKYFVKGGLASLKDKNRMLEHCPIAMWKDWGNYQNDYNRELEDIMMNKDWTKLEVATMRPYGFADNMTWACIYKAVEAEIKDKHPGVQFESEEYWKLVNDRMDYVIDHTQVVDSILHRSEIMRSKDRASKVFSSFMAEPTRTFNMLRSDFIKTVKLAKQGDKQAAVKLFSRTLAVYFVNAAAVSAMAALVDGLRDDDDDQTYWEKVWEHLVENFIDNINPLNLIAFVKDISNAFIDKLNGNYFQSNNMFIDGFVRLADITKDLMKVVTGENEKSTYKILYEISDAFSMLTGVPAKNIMRAGKNIFKLIGVDVDAATTIEEEETVFTKIFGRSSDASKTFNELLSKANKKAKGKTGTAKNDAIWDAVTEGYTNAIEDGDMVTLRAMRSAIESAGGDVSEFDEKVGKKIATQFKKSIGEDSYTVYQLKEGLKMCGYDDEMISDLCYKSNTAQELKACFMVRDTDHAVEKLRQLFDAGLTEEDVYSLYENRSKGTSQVKMKYLKELTGSSSSGYVWPTTGTITDGYGYRSQPCSGASTYHEGLDIAASRGTQVSAAKDGTVISAGYNGSFGYQVVVDHGDGDVTYYSHLYSYSVLPGDHVSQGQRLGGVGSTGTSTGNHLDFRVQRNGEYIDPLTILRG